MNGQDDSIDVKELHVGEPTPITREALTEKMVEHRIDSWDSGDTRDAILEGRIGYYEMTNAELEEIANESYCLCDEDGNEIRYTITDADTSKPSAEELLKEALEALKHTQRVLQTWNYPFVKDAFAENAAIIAKAEGR